MNNWHKIVLLCAFLCGLACAPAWGQEKPKGAKDVKGIYQTIEVAAFDIKPEVKFPAESLTVMMAEIIDELKKTNKFQQVRLQPETKPAPEAAPPEQKPTPEGETTQAAPKEGETAKAEAPTPTIRLSGTIVQYKPGNRTTRYLVGFGAGKTKVVARIKFVDVATGQVLLEKEVDGKVVIGLFGGDSNGATRGLAKEVAKVTRKKFF